MDRIKFQFHYLIVVVISMTVACAPQTMGEDSSSNGNLQNEPTVTLLEAATPLDEAEKPTITIAYDSDIDTIDPHQFRSLGAYDATANLYEPLLTQVLLENAKGQLIGQTKMEGAGAEQFEVSEDGTVFTFYLRGNAQFADGTPITARDYKYTFDRAILGPGYINLLTPFIAVDSPSQIKVIDDYTIEITTSRTAALAETVIGFQVFGAISQATADTHRTGDDPWSTDWFSSNANSSGPYIITQWKPGEEYVFEPNPWYWRGEDWFQNSAVIVKIVPDASDRVDMLLSNEVDIALGVPFNRLEELSRNSDLYIHAIPSSRIYYLGMNVTQPPFDDIRVRQAVSIAIPYQDIIRDVVHDYGSQPTSPISDVMETHSSEFWDYGNVDLRWARELLADAGYPNGFRVNLTIPQEDGTRVNAAALIQEGLDQIGIDVSIEALPTAEFSTKMNDHQVPFFIQEWYSWGNDPFYQLTWNFKCGSFPNFINYCNQDLDSIIEAGTYSRDAEERNNLSRQAQKILVEEAVWAYLYQPDWILVTRSNVTGIALFNDLTLRFGFLGKTE